MSKLVYFLRPVGQIGPIKIGCSRMPQSRLETLSIVSPLRLEMICAVPGTHADERKLHGMFAAHWLHHEWFGASKELLAVVDHAAAHGALPPLPDILPFRLPRAARKNAVAKPHQKRGPNERTRALGLRAKEAYDAGAGVDAIAAQEAVHPSVIRHALKVVGTVMRRQGNPPTPAGVLDETRAAEFKRRYLAGETLKEIGDSYGLTRERVRQILRKTGVDSLGLRPEHCRQAHPLTDDEIAAAELYRDGTRPREIAKRYPGMEGNRLLNILDRLGIPHRTRGEWQVHSDDEQRTADVARLYLAGFSAPQIVKRLPWLKHPETVYRYLKKAGVKARCEKGWGLRWKRHDAPQGVAA